MPLAQGARNSEIDVALQYLYQKKINPFRVEWVLHLISDCVRSHPLGSIKPLKAFALIAYFLPFAIVNFFSRGADFTSANCFDFSIVLPAFDTSSERWLYKVHFTTTMTITRCEAIASSSAGIFSWDFFTSRRLDVAWPHWLHVDDPELTRRLRILVFFSPPLYILSWTYIQHDYVYLHIFEYKIPRYHHPQVICMPFFLTIIKLVIIFFCFSLLHTTINPKRKTKKGLSRESPLACGFRQQLWTYRSCVRNSSTLIWREWWRRLRPDKLTGSILTSLMSSFISRQRKC